MDLLSEHRAAAEVRQQEHIAKQARLAQVAEAVFSTPDGAELLTHLCQRFELTGRTFIPGDRGEINALRAAVRDGERAMVNYLILLIRSANPDFKISV